MKINPNNIKVTHLLNNDDVRNIANDAIDYKINETSSLPEPNKLVKTDYRNKIRSAGINKYTDEIPIQNGWCNFTVDWLDNTFSNYTTSSSIYLDLNVLGEKTSTYDGTNVIFIISYNKSNYTITQLSCNNTNYIDKIAIKRSKSENNNNSIQIYIHFINSPSILLPFTIGSRNNSIFANIEFTDEVPNNGYFIVTEYNLTPGFKTENIYNKTEVDNLIATVGHKNFIVTNDSDNSELFDLFRNNQYDSTKHKIVYRSHYEWHSAQAWEQVSNIDCEIFGATFNDNYSSIFGIIASYEYYNDGDAEEYTTLDWKSIEIAETKVNSVKSLSTNVDVMSESELDEICTID